MDGPALAVPPDSPTTTPKPVLAAPAAMMPAATLSVGEASANPSALPTTRFVAPAAAQVIPADKAAAFVLKLDVKNWVTQTGASHVHMILDNRPYKALFDLKTPVTLGELAGGALGEGEHTLVMFPSRMNHESVKTKGALSTVSFFVGKKTTPAFDAKKGSLVYSRPKGEYKGEASNHVLVDFQLLNVELGTAKNSVKVTVEGGALTAPLSYTVTAFGAPLFLDHLPSGKYSIKTELLAADGALVPGAWNTTSREFVINREATPDAPASTAAAPATGPLGSPGSMLPQPPPRDVLPMPKKPVPPRPPEMQLKPAAAVQAR